MEILVERWSGERAAAQVARPVASPDGVKSDSPSQRQISPQRARIIKNPRGWWFLGT